MTKIQVDFNRRSHDGRVIASSRRADGAVSIGDKVQAVQPEEDMAFDAIVSDVDEKGRVFLEMMWEAPEPKVVAVEPRGGWYQITVRAAVGITAAPQRIARHGSSSLSGNHLANA